MDGRAADVVRATSDMGMNGMDKANEGPNAGRAAYEAYRVAVGGKSVVSGAPLPEWEGLDDLTRTGWLAAGNAAVTHAKQHFPQPGM